VQRLFEMLSTMPPTAGGGIARLALARAAEAGVDLALIALKAGLTPDLIEDRNARISVQSQIEVLNLVADSLRDDMLGFHLAKRFDLREIGPLYYVIASSATRGEALARTERFSTVSNESTWVQCPRTSDVCVRVSYVGVPRHLDRHQMEFIITALLRVFRQVTDADLKPTRVHLAHRRCISSSEIESFFGCNFDFAAKGDELVFARGASQLPLPGADSYLSEILIGFCEEILARRNPRASPLRASVENAIAPLLPHGKARVTGIARVLGMSRRTLARRLAAEDLTFIGILEEMRQELALRYLEDASLSVSRVAWLLGFQEVSAFTHAFRRWTGLTPTQARKGPPNDSGSPREDRTTPHHHAWRSSQPEPRRNGRP
jgi:AraC-like DNA-binding protein